MMEINVLSGFSCARITDKFFDNELETDAYISNMNPCMMFFNGDIQDVRGDDIYVVGEIIETTIDDVLTTYAKNYNQIQALKKILQPLASEYIGGQRSLSGDLYKNSDFYVPSLPSNIRIYYGWTKKSEFRVVKFDPRCNRRKCR
jgi:acid phosphatase class B